MLYTIAHGVYIHQPDSFDPLSMVFLLGNLTYHLHTLFHMHYCQQVNLYTKKSKSKE